MEIRTIDAQIVGISKMWKSAKPDAWAKGLQFVACGRNQGSVGHSSFLSVASIEQPDQKHLWRRESLFGLQIQATAITEEELRQEL